MCPARTIFSTSETYFSAAKRELLSAFRDVNIEQLAPDTGCLEANSMDIAEVAEVCLARPIVFVQHLMRESARLRLSDGVDDLDRVAETALGILTTQRAAPELALQVWAAGGASSVTFRSDELRQRVADALSQDGFVVARANHEHILSICITPRGIVLGVNRRADALTDWPGGRVGLARDAGQISRAEFKLDELIQVFDVSLSAGGKALDLGASPGGWTRVLRRRGFTVWAIDPADLDPRVAADPGVHHVQTTAAPFLAETGELFDLVANDMRMVPALSCQLMREAVRRLKPHGLAIMTLKISPHNPLETVRASLRELGRSYEILFARQLFHNRNEVTIVARRKHEAPGHERRSARSSQHTARRGAAAGKSLAGLDQTC
jgi:23S rRNA (cytidine2498-2'-O)-methyltransferase